MTSRILPHRLPGEVPHDGPARHGHDHPRWSLARRARPPRRSRRHSRHRRHHHRDRPARAGRPGRRGGDRRAGHAAASRADQRPHARPRQPGQGHGRPLDARAPAHRRAVDQRQPLGGRSASQRQDRRGRDGAQGRHRGLRPAARATGTDARGRAVAGPRLCRGRHARGDRADGRRPHDVRSDPRPDGRAEPGAARGRRQATAGAVEDQHRWDARGTARLDARSSADRPRGGADHPASLLGRVHPRLRGPGQGVRRRPA